MTAAERRLELQNQAARTSGSLPPLLLAAERVASNVAQGLHGRRRVGQGEAFWQFRRYDNGDPARAIDWRQSAKSHHLFVRETEWEAAQSAWLWRDTSPSMQYSSGRNLTTKAARADLLLLGLALLLMRAGERFALLGSAKRARSGRLAFDQIANHMLSTTNVAENLPPYCPLPRHGQVILIGDFLLPPDEIATRIAAFAARGVTGLFLQIVDPGGRSSSVSRRNSGMSPDGSGSKVSRTKATWCWAEYNPPEMPIDPNSHCIARRCRKSPAALAGFTSGILRTARQNRHY